MYKSSMPANYFKYYEGKKMNDKELLKEIIKLVDKCPQGLLEGLVEQEFVDKAALVNRRGVHNQVEFLSEAGYSLTELFNFLKQYVE